MEVELIPKYCKFNRVWSNDSEVGELTKVSKLFVPSAMFRAELTTDPRLAYIHLSLDR